MVVKRGNLQQYLYHLHDGSEQEERDRKMRMVPTEEGEALAWRDPGLAPKLLGYECEKDVSLFFSVLCYPSPHFFFCLRRGRRVIVYNSPYYHPISRLFGESAF